MVIKRTFATRRESVEAFGLANELLRSRGFTLDAHTTLRSRQWHRGTAKARGVINLPQTIFMDFDTGRVAITASATVTGRRAPIAQRVLTAYAEALEKLLALGQAPDAAAAGPRSTERSIRRAAASRALAICVIVLGVIGGGIALASSLPRFPDPRSWIGPTPARNGATAAKKGRTPPVVVVRRAGAQTSATKPTEPPQ